MMPGNRSPFAGQTGRSTAQGPSRRGVRPTAKWIAGALVLLLGCGLPGLSRGVWLSVEGPEQYALKFTHAGGLLSGTMHQFREGKQVAQWGFAGTRRGAAELELSWGRNNALNATVDLDLGELRGRVQLADGRVFDTLFRRTDAASVRGLAAQAELPYRLRPPAPGSGWRVADAGALDIDPRHLEATVRAVTRGEAGLLHSLVIVRRGRLVVEEYFHGYERGDLHETQSVTKSVASLLVGIACDRGQISSLDEPVLEYFPRYAETASAGWQRVTLRHLLTMTAGVDWEGREVVRGHGIGPELFDKVLARRLVHEPGDRWLYNGADVELLAGVLRHATGLQADELARRQLFEPLGITTWEWELGKTEGYPSLAGALHLRPLDMAKIGQLVLDGGRWQGKRVVSEEWITESTQPLVGTGREAQKYGYLWWRLDAPLKAGRYPVIVASGWGSQFIHVVPALEAVIVTTGGNHFNGKNYDIGGVLLRRLVPGVESRSGTWLRKV